MKSMQRSLVVIFFMNYFCKNREDMPPSGSPGSATELFEVLQGNKQ